MDECYKWELKGILVKSGRTVLLRALCLLRVQLNKFKKAIKLATGLEIILKSMLFSVIVPEAK